MKHIMHILIIVSVLIVETTLALGIWALGDLYYREIYISMKEDENRKLIEDMTQNAKKNPELALSIIEQIIETNKTFDEKKGFHGVSKEKLEKEYLIPILENVYESLALKAKSNPEQTVSVINEILKTYNTFDNADFDGITEENMMKNYVAPLLEKASDLGYPESQYLFGRWCMGWPLLNSKYENPNPNKEKAAYWFLQSCKNNHIDAYGRMGICYKYGYGVNQDFKKCIEWLLKGAESGSAYAQYFLGCTYEVGLYVKYYKPWSWNGDVNGNYYWSEGIIYNDIYKNDKIVNSKGSICYYKLGTETDRLSDYQITQFDESKTRTYLSKDIEKAKYYWKLAADSGYDAALEKLQKIY